MSNILKAISEDRDDYAELCQRFGEEARSSCYGEHAKALRKRAHDEDEALRVAHIERSAEYRALRTMLIALLGRLEDRGLGRAITEDSALRAWWKNNRKEYDAEKAEKAEAEKRRLLATKARSKLSPEERKALGV